MPSLQPAPQDFLETAPHRVVSEALIHAPIDRCWDALAEAATWVDWFPGLTKATSDPPVWTAAGDTRTVTVNRLTVDERAIVVDRPDRWGFAIVSWPLPIASMAAEGVRLTDETSTGSGTAGTGTGAQTRLQYTGAFDLNPFGRLVWPILRRQLADGWRAGFEGLGTYLEAGA